MAGNNLPLYELTALSPLDGRYRKKIQELSQYFSEFALIKTRIEIEARYLIALSKIKIVRALTQKEKDWLLSLAQTLTIEDIKTVKTIEEETRHDVKAMERAFRKFVHNTSLSDITEMIHVGLTSEDINNVAYRLMIQRATHTILIPLLFEIGDYLSKKSREFRSLPMLARTHGQAAVPTTLGKELVVFAVRLEKQLSQLKTYNMSGKLNGAVGNFNALVFLYPRVDWLSFSQHFLKSLGLYSNVATTQINTYEDIIEFLQILQRINNIFIDINQDAWRYISDHWFVQEVKKGEVGSSTMPQKVNPIDFENSEGNLGMANTVIEYFVRKLPISRLQRDLSDSTVLRNIGSIFGYSLLGYLSIKDGFLRIKPNTEQIQQDLQKDWAILTEGVQTFLRKNGVSDPYSLIASLSRGTSLQASDWKTFIKTLPIDKNQKDKLATLTPQTYIGLAEIITEKALLEIKRLRKV